jgi:hypothetical protein
MEEGLMAEEKKDGEKNPTGEIPSDSGLGNLPPLSDFDSRGEVGGSDSGLPPLGKFGDLSDHSGLPPISDLQVETPVPSGGNIKPPPPGYETPGMFSSGGVPSKGSGFQDLAADSDFSPETPEIGPGPGLDSNVDTPMFDSAFGGAGGGFDFAGMRTPAPTQAMETPMFGAPAVAAPAPQSGFDAGAFGAGFDFGGGTPAPDFSPDTDFQQPTPANAPEGKKPKAPKKSGGNGLAVILLAAGLIVGLCLGPLVMSKLSFLPVPNPVQDELTKAKDEVAKLNKDLQKYRSIPQASAVTITPEQLKELEEKIRQANVDLQTASGKLDETNKSLNDKNTALAAINDDIKKKTEEFVTAQEMYEDLQNETAIVQARQKGLIAEVERLTSQVGALDEANQRSVSTKEALMHAVDRLVVQIKESIPLAPEKYSHTTRLALAEGLRDQLSSAKWVTPALMDSYTDVYVKELEIAGAQDYFFAKLPVTDQFGTMTQKGCECVMNGNWSVYFRSIDGANVGSYQNISIGGTMQWGVKEDFQPPAKKEIEALVSSKRVPDYEQKIKALAQKQAATQEGTTLQRTFGSL